MWTGLQKELSALSGSQFSSSGGVQTGQGVQIIMEIQACGLSTSTFHSLPVNSPQVSFQTLLSLSYDLICAYSAINSAFYSSPFPIHNSI